MTNTTVVVQADTLDERIEVVCYPFEPDDPAYDGDRYLGLMFDGQEESFVVLDRSQAEKLAALLTDPQGVAAP